MCGQSGFSMVFLPMLCLIFGMLGGCELATTYWKKEAIKAGHAEYLADEHGEPVFQWKAPSGSLGLEPSAR